MHRQFVLTDSIPTYMMYVGSTVIPDMNEWSLWEMPLLPEDLCLCIITRPPPKLCVQLIIIISQLCIAMTGILLYEHVHVHTAGK